MFMPNRISCVRKIFKSIGLLACIFSGFCSLEADTRVFSFTTSKGLPIRVLQDSEMPFVHAQLIVFLDGPAQNYEQWAISQLTIMNMFARELNSPSSNLLDSFFRLGNDYQVEQTPEYVKISINFLPDRLASFPKLLKEIFTYQSFHLKKFNESKFNYWSLYSKNKDWKMEIAFLLAYQQAVANFYFGQGFINQEVLNKINLAQLRSFHLKTFKLDNALLIIKGKINPHIALGLLEKDLFIAGSRAAKVKEDEARINAGRRIFILNTVSSDAPMVYWFDLAPTSLDANYLPFFIGNFVLFGFPDGRIYQSERNRFLLGGYKVNTEVFSMKNFTVFCNSVRLNYGDVESFLLLVDQERKKFAAKPIIRKEYLEALNHFLGQVQVETGRFTYGLQQEIDRFRDQSSVSIPQRRGNELAQEVTFERVTQVMDDLVGYKHKSGAREKGIVVLVGNANMILNNLKILKAETIDLLMD